MENLREIVRNGYGIELVDVRVRRFNYPEKVRPAIAERIISERRKKAADYESEGIRRASDITSEASRDSAITIAQAKAEEQKLKQQATVEAERIRNEAHAQDAAFFEFLQRLQSYQAMLAKTQDILLLSTRHEFFQQLLKPPSTKDKKPAGDGK